MRHRPLLMRRMLLMNGVHSCSCCSHSPEHVAVILTSSSVACRGSSLLLQQLVMFLLLFMATERIKQD